MSDSSSHDSLPEALRSRIPSLSVIAMPADTNAFGNIFGGWLMSQMDLASSQKAMEATGQDLVTRVATISFDKPVFIGDKVSFYTDVGRVGTTSIAISNEAWALRRGTRKYEKVGQGEFVFVAIDKDKNKIPITRIA
jgi:acyl-CoA thioesterase YciA